MVITFNSSNIAVDAYETLKNRVYEDKNLLGKEKKSSVIFQLVNKNFGSKFNLSSYTH